ncbi:MAG: hypothetical protein Q7S37_00295 [bacterium]|nr:hypothetical protein [bacterium]
MEEEKKLEVIALEGAAKFQRERLEVAQALGILPEGAKSEDLTDELSEQALKRCQDLFTPQDSLVRDTLLPPGEPPKYPPFEVKEDTEAQ